MEKTPVTDPVKSAARILKQLGKFVQQLAASEKNPEVDVPALSRACGRRLEELKKVLPAALAELSPKQGRSAAGLPEGAAILQKAEELKNQSLLCLRMFENRIAGVSREMGRLQTTRRALKAYSR